MQLVVVVVAVLIVACGTFVDARVPRIFHEKTRFDRSVEHKYQADVVKNHHALVNKKQRIFADTATGYTAYRDGAQSVCYLEKLKGNGLDSASDAWRDVIVANKKNLYASDRSLTKVEAWRLAGGRVVDFCHGMTFILLQDARPDADISEDDPFLNALPEDENDIVQKRVADVVLRPLRVRAKRQAIAEERERLNREDERVKRDAEPHRAGRFRGQTQSQYLSVGSEGDKEGKAEAEATQHASRAVVSL